MELLWVVTFFLGVMGDVMSGVVRYYSSALGVPQAIYLPKAMMAVSVVFIVIQRPKVSHLLAAMYLAMQACISLSNGIALSAVAFWVWTVMPLLFALAAPPEALAILNRPRARKAAVVMALICAAGVLINYSGFLNPEPWIGATTMVGGTAVHVSDANFVGTTPRLPGFGRDSAATGLMLGLLATWLVPRYRAFTMPLLLLGIAGFSIWATTNKTALVAVIFVLGIARFCKLLTLRKATICAAAGALLVPLAAYVITYAVNESLIGGGALSSFQDRFDNTWPLLLKGMLRENMIWFGMGPGGFGAATSYYHSNFGFNTGYADNIALWVIANFGVVGVVICSALLSRILFSSRSADKVAWAMMMFLLISGITTDIFESVGCLIFFGTAAKALWLDAHVPRIQLSPEFPLPFRHRKPIL